METKKNSGEYQDATYGKDTSLNDFVVLPEENYIPSMVTFKFKLIDGETRITNDEGELVGRVRWFGENEYKYIRLEEDQKTGALSFLVKGKDNAVEQATELYNMNKDYIINFYISL